MTIALVERVWHGHVPSYYRMFCQFTMELGYDLLAICPAPDEIAAAAQNARPLPGSVMGKLEVMKFTPPRVRIRPRRFQPWVDCFLDVQWLRRALRDWEAAHGEKVGLVFFTCIYDGHFVYFPESGRGFPWPWSGLYIHCRTFRLSERRNPQTGVISKPERIFKHPNLRSAGIMDEAAVEWMTRIAKGRKAVAVPDFTDETPPEAGGIGEEVRLFAGGRPVVGVMGHLQPSKGIATLARVALDPACSDIVFVFAGQLTGTFDPDDAVLLERLKSAPNVFSHLKSLPSEASFNGIANACDVLFAAYHDFPHSSNILTKAAFLRKPVIASDGYLMAERVRRYRLGEVIPQKHPASCVAALRKILDNKDRWIKEAGPQWEAYATANSREAARRAFAELIASATPG